MRTQTELTLKILARIISNGDINLAKQAEEDIARLANFRPSFSSEFTGSFLEVADKLWPRNYYPNGYFDIRSDFVGSVLSPDDWSEILTSLADESRNGVSFSIEALGGAIDDLDNNATAYAHRKSAKFVVQYVARLIPGQPYFPRIEALKRLQSSFSAFTTGGAYYNYPERDRAHDLTEYWGDNFPKLKSIKTAYDPDNLFNHALSIPVDT